jgi:PAS domain S-box-containing protein
MLGAVMARRQAEKAIELSEARYRSLIQTQSDIIARSDMDGNLTFVNDSYCHVFGKSSEELLGKPFTSFVLPEDLSTSLKILEEVKHPPYRKQTDSRQLTAVGVRWYSWDNSAVLGEDGSILEFQGVGRDVTERKRAEEALLDSEKRYRAIVVDQTEFVVRWKPDGMRTFANAAYCRYFDLTYNAVVGTSFWPLIASEEQQGVRDRLARLTPENPVSTFSSQMAPGAGRSGQTEPCLINRVS